MLIYGLEIILDLLESFKVKNILFTDLSDEQLVNTILNFDASFTALDSSKNYTNDNNINIINECPLNIFNEMVNFDAIFINDDSNWYTVYNELKLIYSKEFPLVFICNNRFPNKRRDSYINPNLIPNEFLNDFVRGLPVCYDGNYILLPDELYHAKHENTPKNGVFTAIEDFLNENTDISILDINIVPEITVLYPKSTISKIRIDKFKEQIMNKEITNFNFSDKFIENKILLNYINQNNLNFNDSFEDVLNLEIAKKDQIIRDYENKIRLHDNEIGYKNSQIISVEGQLDLKDTQIMHIESKLINKENEIGVLQNQIQKARLELDNNRNLESELISKENEIGVLQNQIQKARLELDTNLHELSCVKQEHFSIMRRINDEKYCIKCFKEEISNNKLELQYLKHQTILKKFISPLSYLYLIFKSNPKEISINIKLFNVLKNSKCFDIGYYLNNNIDIQNSKWMRYFSPELHYVCNGFDENRQFNKKYYNRNSKQDLLKYLKICENE